MTQQEFYNKPEIKALVEIQKQNPWGSVNSRQSWKEIKLHLIAEMGEAFANQQMKSYE